MSTTNTIPHPFDRVVQALDQRGCFRARGCRRTSDRARASCPTHGDARPSLSVTRRDDRVLIRCFAGCRAGDIVGALGLKMADLFSTRNQTGGRMVILSTYDYVSVAGELIAQKVRLAPKQFRWRTPTSGARSGWRWGLNGAEPGLYRLPDLINERQVWLVEGEKAANMLSKHGLPATCGHAGTSTWRAQWSLDLWHAGCRELIILPDHDRSGERHAEVVAATSFHVTSNGEEPMAVKVAPLPGLQVGADVVDWLDGRSIEDLVSVVSSASWWFPGAIEQQCRERRRALTLERVRRHRERARERRLEQCARNVVDVQQGHETRNDRNAA